LYNVVGGSTLESAPHFIPTSSANLFQPFTSSQPTAVSVSFGVPTVANMTRKSKGAVYTTSTASAGLSTAHVTSGQTNVEEADSESSMPCSLPDDVANQYAQYVDCLSLSTLVPICCVVLTQLELLQILLQLLLQRKLFLILYE